MASISEPVDFIGDKMNRPVMCGSSNVSENSLTKRRRIANQVGTSPQPKIGNFARVQHVPRRFQLDGTL